MARGNFGSKKLSKPGPVGKLLNPHRKISAEEFKANQASTGRFKRSKGVPMGPNYAQRLAKHMKGRTI